MKHIFEYIVSLLQSTGMEMSSVRPVATALGALAAIIVAALFYAVILIPASSIVNKIIKGSKTEIDDILLPPKIIKAIAITIVSFLISYIFPSVTYYYPDATNTVANICAVLNILCVAYLLTLETKAFCKFLRFKNAEQAGVLVLRNTFETIIVGVAVLLIISTVLNRDIAYVVSALGAMAAVLLLVFKDSILGMIAGIRLSINGMLKEKDWIIVPKYHADGRVEDVSLTTVKIRNWDKSISTIPPHALMSEGFINKQRMLDMGVRQIKRTFLVDINSVRVLTQEESEQFAGKSWCEDIERSSGIVNLSLFRRWLRHKMLNHPRRAQSEEDTPMQVFVREYPATPTGLPLEVFFFVDCVDWEEFEQLQADFIDEITASFPRFHLRLYQALATLPSPDKQ